MQQRKALGKGLASLIPTEDVDAKIESAAAVVGAKVLSEAKGPFKVVNIDDVVPNRLQPRKEFNEESLEELADSIRTNGVIQPLIVSTAVGGRYELIAGERRLRASKLAGLEKVPVIIKDVSTEEMLEMAIVENVQREDLNPIDEAKAYKELVDEFGYTQDEVAKKVGKSRPHVANIVRLLNLPKVIQEDLIVGRLSSGHARALLALTDLQQQLKLREKIIDSNLNVREVEKMIQDIQSGATEKGGKKEKKRQSLTPQMKAVVEELKKSLGTKVSIHPKGAGGQILIEYYSMQDLNKIYRMLIS